MKDRKCRLELFSFYDHFGLEQHLEKMAERGWMLERISGCIWTYKRVEPETLTFAVNYDPVDSVFRAEPTEAQFAFREFCRYDGWGFAASHGKMQIFYNRAENPTPLETDEEIQEDKLKRAAKRSWIPGWGLLLALCLCHVIIHLIQLEQAQRMFLSMNSWLFSSFYWTMGTLLSAGELAGYFLHCPATRWKRWCLAVLGMGILGWLAAFPWAMPRLDWVQGTVELLWLVSLPLMAAGICTLLKRKKMDVKANGLVTLTVSAVLGIALGMGLLSGLSTANARGLFEENVELYSYEEIGPDWRKGQKMKAWHDELPLTVEDFVGMPMEGYSCRLEEYNTLFLRESIAGQNRRLDDVSEWEAPDPVFNSDFQGKPQLDYSIIEVKLPFLYEVFKDEILSTYDGIDPAILSARYVPVDPSPWGAEQAYELRQQAEFQGSHNWLYLLCYRDRLVLISLDWEPTEAHKAIVAEKLGQ